MLSAIERLNTHYFIFLALLWCIKDLHTFYKRLIRVRSRYQQVSGQYLNTILLLLVRMNILIC